MECYSALDRKEILTHATTWIHLGRCHATGNKPVMKGKILYDSIYVRYLQQSNSWRQKAEGWLVGAGGRRNGEVLFNGYGISVLEDKKSSGERWWWCWWLHNAINALNATELCTSKWLKRWILCYVCFRDFPGGASGKQPTCQCRRPKRPGFNPWVGKIPWRRNGNPLQYSCLENSMDKGA